MQKINLGGIWSLEGLSPENEKIELCAKVPGCVLGAIVDKDVEKCDIFYRDCADKFLKYENYSWVYKKSFTVEARPEKAKLWFSKLDTYCDVYLNGKHLGHTENGHIPHAFDASKALAEGENTIEIFFTSPIYAVKGKKPLEGAFTTERLHTRRMQCTYGWDWTMRFVTCGIGEAYLEEVTDDMKIDSAYVYTKYIDEESAEIGIDIEVGNSEKGGYIAVCITDDEGKNVYEKQLYCEEELVRLSLDIADPHLWYPLGYGSQPIYSVDISVNEKLCYHTTFGIRLAKIQELPDKPDSEASNLCKWLKTSEFSQQYDFNEQSSNFVLKINGKKIMCKGANWVPCEPFVIDGMEEKITKTLELAAKAGVNMVRVWGGGSFECEHFYDECSRFGILVTQDFLMACGKYPEDEKEFIAHLEKEAEYAVRLIRNKPCLAWWTGDNENAVNGCDTDTDYNGRSSAYKGIAPTLYRLDPYRRFLPSSPYGGKNYASNTVGTTHNTQYLSSFFEYITKPDLSDYKEELKKYCARFIAEEPCFGAIEKTSLSKFMTDEDIYGDDDYMWKYHSKTNPGLGRELFDHMTDFASKILSPFTDNEDRYFKLRYLQCEWIRVSLERARRNKFFCSGNIFWMLNDCWPAASGWAIIDYYCKPKAAFYAFRRCAAPVIVTVDLDDGKYTVSVCNDGKETKLSLRWHAVNPDGNIMFTSDDIDIVSKENVTDKFLTFDESDVPEGCFVVAEISDRFGIVDRAFFKKGALGIYRTDDRLETVSEDSSSITVKAKAYIHALSLSGRIFDDNYFSMMPGETRKIAFVKDEFDTDIEVVAYTI